MTDYPKYDPTDNLTVYSDRQARRIATIKARYGEDFFERKGHIGGKAKTAKGFAKSGKATEAGKKGLINRWKGQKDE